MLKGCCLVSEPLRSGDTTVCSGKPHTFVPSQTRSCLFCYCTKAALLGMKWVQFSPLSFTKRSNKSDILAETWWKAGLWARSWFCISGMDKVLTNMATKFPRWLQTLLKTVCLPSPSITEPLHTMPGQLLHSGLGSQSCCLPPSPSLWVTGEFKCEDGWRANLCHNARGRPKCWNTIWYWFYSL